MAYEQKSWRCWDCEFFLQTSLSQKNGYCVRKAPSKIQAAEGVPVRGPIWGVFGPLLDATQSECGEFKKASQPYPDPPA